MSEHVEITREGAEVIARMATRVLTANAEYGPDTEEVQEMTRSFVVAMRAVVQLGGKLMAEGDEGLYGINEFIHFGLVSHPIGDGIPEVWVDSAMESFDYTKDEALEFAKEQGLTACVSYSVNS